MDNKNKWFRIGERAKTFLIVGIALIAVLVFLQNFGVVVQFIKDVFELISPFLWGIALAYLLSLLMTWLERKLLFKIKKKKTKRALSLTLTLVLSVAFVVGFFFALIPQLASSISSLVSGISGHIEDAEELVMGWANDIGISSSFIHSMFGSWEEIIKAVTDWAKSLIPGIVGAGVKVGSGIFKAFISLFVAIYVLVDIERLQRQIRLASLAIFSEKRFNQLEVVRKKCHKAFGGFLVGKVIDSTIVGIACFIFMTIFGMPYAPLISFINAVTNIIPTFGPFIGGIPSVFIIFIVDPIKALWFGIFIIILQQIDGNILGPYILGDAVGLSALWILFAVVFFGSIWGVTGMIIGVPLFAVCYDLMGDFIRKRLKKRGLDPDNPDQTIKEVLPIEEPDKSDL